MKINIQGIAMNQIIKIVNSNFFDDFIKQTQKVIDDLAPDYEIQQINYLVTEQRDGEILNAIILFSKVVK